ncbi:GNAT family N-acetyltransferase [Streptosporangium saharense]|uniref:RimJ/RimL family protein N-acetyltransferase n=1 Tax=Streptosporangium saharense TaxID=1706840 RepID=A0A7W7QH02_9ACTN|nr:GNAT family protein [Streptosporangium saharense]MBB4913457.1 RimJ/RimL family protein N-acetyltransferase [Streptosporangium saharense]
MGKKTALGPYRADLVEQYWRWEQDPATLVGYGRQTPDSLESRTEGLAHQLSSLGDTPRFTVYDVTGGGAVPVGTTVLYIDQAVRTAEFVIMLGPEARGRGLGTEATRLTLDYAWHVTNLRMVWLKVLEPNAAGVAAYRRAGFREAGRLRQAGYWLGRVCDEIVMDTLAEEFTGTTAIRLTP